MTTQKLHQRSILRNDVGPFAAFECHRAAAMKAVVWGVIDRSRTAFQSAASIVSQQVPDACKGFKRPLTIDRLRHANKEECSQCGHTCMRVLQAAGGLPGLDVALARRLR
jgi:hypothetical protein